MAKALKLIGVLLSVGWFIGFLYALMSFAKATSGSSFWWWYATIAHANNFSFAILVGIPVLLLFAPVGLLTEWLWQKGDTLDEREQQTHAPRDTLETARRPPNSPPKTPEETAALAAKTREGEARTAAYLANYFGPAGPSSPKQRTRRLKRGARRNRY